MRELLSDKFYCEVSEDFYPALPNGVWTALFGKASQVFLPSGLVGAL